MDARIVSAVEELARRAMAEHPEAAQAVLKLLEQTGTDDLTGLTTRRVFLDGLEREWLLARRDQVPSYIFVADLDELGTINARHGEEAGDAALRRFADVLRDVTRQTDVVARLGDDEFAVLLVRARNSAAPPVLESRLEEALREVSAELPFTLSAATAWSSLVGSQSPGAALAAAEQAMRLTKQVKRPPAPEPPDE